MKKDELIKLISKNIDEFNLEKAKLTARIDLSEADFSGLEIMNADFSNIDFTGANFAEGTLENVNFANSDLTGADFTRAHIKESDFSQSILNGADFSYSDTTYSNFQDADMSGCILNEADLSESDFAAAENMSACRFDDGTVWPDVDKLPEDFDSTYSFDLSSLKDEEDDGNGDFGY